MHTTITDEQRDRALALRDLSDPAQGAHAMQLVHGEICAALEQLWNCPVREHRASPIVSVHENYEQLGYPPDAPAMEARYTRYLDDTRLLRSHTSAMVPAAVRAHADGAATDLVIAPVGLVYRRDAVDRLHVGEPHQLDLWRVRRVTALTEADLDELVATVVDAVLPGAEHRSNPADHPYTTRGREVEVLVDGRWVELLECGLAGRHVLEAGGLDVGWSGLALGLGLDRALMLRKRIGDIRLLRSDDPRVVRQMLTLEPYRPVSAMPATQRDLSLAVAADLTAEDLGDRVRQALAQADLESVEEIAILAETPGPEMPPSAAARIGLREGQKNALVRLVLRHPTRTLTAVEANRVRNEVYAALHEGGVHQWAG